MGFNVVATVQRITIQETDGEETMVRDPLVLSQQMIGRGVFHWLPLLDGQKSLLLPEVSVQDITPNQGNTVCTLSVTVQIL